VSVASNRGKTIVVAVITRAVIAITLKPARNTGFSHTAITTRIAAIVKVTVMINAPLTCGSTFKVVPKKPKATPINAIVPASINTATR
jgi:hypothetical protein